MEIKAKEFIECSRMNKTEIGVDADYSLHPCDHGVSGLNKPIASAWRSHFEPSPSMTLSEYASKGLWLK